MNVLIYLLRLIPAVLMPIGTAILSYLALRMAGQGQPGLPAGEQTCVRCGQSQPGACGIFAYTQGFERLRRQMQKKQPSVPELVISDPEEHFICDPCVQRYIRQEILFQILMVVPYPVYRMAILTFYNQSRGTPNILLEAFLMLLSIAGALAALNLYQALRSGETPQAEIRDRLAIQARRKILGKDLGYYTRAGMHNLKK